MWIDARGSEVLQLPECRRLLALGSKRHLPGHLGVATEGAPLVLPVDYAAHGSDVLVQVGESLLTHIDGRMVAFEVDSYEQGAEDLASEGRWSVLVRGLASELEDAFARAIPPRAAGRRSRPPTGAPSRRRGHRSTPATTGRCSDLTPCARSLRHAADLAAVRTGSHPGAS